RTTRPFFPKSRCENGSSRITEPLGTFFGGRPQAAEHVMDHTHADHGLAGRRLPLVVLAQSPRPRPPGAVLLGTVPPGCPDGPAGATAGTGEGATLAGEFLPVLWRLVGAPRPIRRRPGAAHAEACPVLLQQVPPGRLPEAADRPEMNSASALANGWASARLLGWLARWRFPGLRCYPLKGSRSMSPPFPYPLVQFPGPLPDRSGCAPARRPACATGGAARVRKEHSIGTRSGIAGRAMSQGLRDPELRRYFAPPEPRRYHSRGPKACRKP